jgi:hypothetical protein
MGFATCFEGIQTNLTNRADQGDRVDRVDRIDGGAVLKNGGRHSTALPVDFWALVRAGMTWPLQEGVMVSIYQAKDHRWRDAFNPLRGLSMPRSASLEVRSKRAVCEFAVVLLLHGAVAITAAAPLTRTISRLLRRGIQRMLCSSRTHRADF